MGRGGASNNGPATHVNLNSKLDLRPHDTYDENIEAVERLADGDFEMVGDIDRMHPRVFHEAFKRPYQTGVSPARVDEEGLEQMQEVLHENSERDPSWVGEKLFNIGYAQRVYGIENIGDLFDTPAMDFSKDYMPDPNVLVPENPYNAGKRKKKGDRHYDFAAGLIYGEISDWDIEIV